MTKVDLSQFDLREDRPEGYHHGPLWRRLLWYYISAFIFQTQLFPMYGLKVWLLRKFGATVGEHVEIKPAVQIKYPWNLTLGDYVWIGERVWIDCSKPVIVGSHVMISQGAFLCPGTHDREDPGMGTYGYPIVVEDGVWICAMAQIGLGLTLGEDSVILLGAVVVKDTEPSGIYGGNPAKKIGERKIRDYPGPKREEPEPAPEPKAVAAS